MNINKYLESLQDTEAVGNFAVDSFPKKKKKRKRSIITAIYPNENWVVLEQANRRAMIDLDGTIHKYSKGYSDGTIYDDPFEGAKRVIGWLKDKGFEIIIFTTRASAENAKEMGGDHKDQIKSVENWLKLNGIYFDKVTAEKLAADFYIDDKAIFIKDGNWDAVLKTIKKRMKFG